MSTAIAAYHGAFGRATVYQLNRPIKTHAHREGHLIFNLAGPSSWGRTARGAALMNSETAAAVNPWEPHEFIPGDRHGGARFLVLYISPGWFSEARRGADAPLRFGKPEFSVSPRIRMLIECLRQALTGSGGASCLDSAIYDLTAASYAASWQGVSQPDFAPRAADYTDFRVRKSIGLIAGRLGSLVELDDVARESGLSRPHFYKLFREQTGLTPHLYLNTLRMESAIERLTRTGQAVTEIGLDLGFATPSSFAKFFAGNAGIPPADYRRASMVETVTQA